MVSKEEVQAFYEKFPEELKPEDTSSLERIYAHDYILVRPNGDTLTKEQILADLRHHSMRFTSFDVNDVLIRTKGPVGILFRSRLSCAQSSKSNWTGTSSNARTARFCSSAKEERSEYSARHGRTHAFFWG